MHLLSREADRLDWLENRGRRRADRTDLLLIGLYLTLTGLLLIALCPA